LIALIATIVPGAGGGLATMNSACKTSHHSWCASNYSVLHHSKNGQSYRHGKSEKGTPYYETLSAFLGGSM
jgi:hypothetical protein